MLAAAALSLSACQPPTLRSDDAAAQATPPPAAAEPAPEPAPPPAPPPAQAAPAPAVALPEAPVAEGPGAAPPPSPGPVPVALLVPLSGESAQLGRAMFRAAQLALFDVGNEDLVLLPRDTRGTPEGAAEMARAALADGARLILGPLFADSVAAVTPHARDAGVSVVAFSSDRAAARPGVFVMGHLPAQQVERIAGFAGAEGLRRIAALAPDDAYGQRVVGDLRRASAAAGVTVVDAAFYPAAARAASDVDDLVRALADFDRRRRALEARRDELRARGDADAAAALARLEDADTLGPPPFDAVFLPEGGARLLTVAPLLPFYDVDLDGVRLLGTARWESAPLGAEPALIGGWFAAPPPAARRVFEARFERFFGAPPPRLATLAYDAVALAGALAAQPDGPGLGAAALAAPDGFRGVDGLFRFLPDGTNERGLAVLEVAEDGVRTVDPAPESFAAGF